MSDPRSQGADCPDLETLAAYIDGRLKAAERAEVEAHLSNCDACREVVVDAMEAAEETREPETISSDRSADNDQGRAITPVPAPRRWPWIVAGVGLAATVVLMLLPVGALRRSPVRELVAAVGTDRVLEPRLSGGFQWGQRPSTTRSATSSNVPRPEVQIAASRIAVALRGDRSAERLGAFAAAELTLGRPDSAVAALEEATGLAPDSADVWSDLSAAYFVRSMLPDHAIDVPRSLEAADRALRLQPSHREALFNRALALQRLQLRREAIEAWEQYLAVDRDSAWAAEARERLAQIRAGSAIGTPTGPQPIRDRVLNELLPAWAEAAATQSAEAAQRLRDARTLAASIDAATSDQLVQDALTRIPEHAPWPQALIDGHQSYGRGMRAHSAKQHQTAIEELSRSAIRLGAAGSPIAASASAYVAAARVQLGSFSAARKDLLALAGSSAWRRYPTVRGRVEWTLGFIELSASRRGPGMAHLDAGLDAFRLAGDVASAGFMNSLKAEAFFALGNVAESWELRLPGLAHDQRNAALLSTAQAARDTGWLGVARDVLDEAAARAVEESQDVDWIDALRAQAIVLARLGAYREAEARLSEARTRAGAHSQWVRLRNELDAAEALVAAEAGNVTGIAAADRATGVFREARAVRRLPSLLLARARLFQAAGEPDRQRTDLEAALNLLEEEQRTVPAGDLRLMFGDELHKVSDELVRFALSDGKPSDAFAAAERGRIVAKPSRGKVLRATLAQLQSSLPTGATVAYYVTSERHVTRWLITRDAAAPSDLPITTEALLHLISSYNAQGCPRELGRRLGGLLLEGLESKPRGSLLVIVPDGPLTLLPFAPLAIRDDAYLIEDFPILIAASATSFLRASRTPVVPAARSGLSVVAIGNPDFDRGAFPNLALLPGAEEEARQVARRYAGATVLTGGAATRERTIAAWQSADVFHFGGHAIINDLRPSQSQLVIGTGAVSGLRAADIEALDLGRTKLVVLAACNAAAGLVTRAAGPLGLTRSVLAAGVPTVVASTRQVDDRVSLALFTAFHDAYRRDGNAVGALRRAQLLLAQDADARLSSPAAWGSFLVIGGADSLNGIALP